MTTNNHCIRQLLPAPFKVIHRWNSDPHNVLTFVYFEWRISVL